MIPSSTNTNKRYFFIFIRKILLFIDFSAKVDKKRFTFSSSPNFIS